MNKIKKQSYIVTLAAALFVYILFGLCVQFNIFNRHQNAILNFICINIILAVSLNVTVGCLGQINLGHAGFMSIGAYTAALISKNIGSVSIPTYLLALLAGGFLAALIGILIGIPALRLKGDYLAIITLGFGEIIRVLIEYFQFTGGAQGLRSIPRMQNFSVIYWLMILSVVLLFTVMTGRHGRVVLAIREDEIAAEAIGINTTYAKTFAFVLSAFFAGIAGGIYAHNTGIIGAKMFDYNFSINILVMVVLGGMGSFTGAILSAIVLTVLPEMLREFSDYRMVAYSLLLILMMLFRPKGLLGRSEFQISRVIEYINIKREHRRKEGLQ